ncbi:MAG: cupin domain-containing protein [Rhizobiales bacterium]|nr:cupin domain-containing protein [Hyphomicrobiales bacterium]OJX98690.1 MAG: cupin [Rhizobiales bacterium 63-22]
MSLLIRIDPNPAFAPKESQATPDRLISGNPSFKTWPQDASKDDKVLTGIWEATPGETHSIKGTTLEFCHILSGLVEIEEKGGATQTFRAGDSFVMKPGFVGVWRTIETVRKIYLCVYE